MNSSEVVIKYEKNCIMKDIKKNKANSKVIEDNPIVTSPRIDKLSGVVDLHDADYCGAIYNAMLGWWENNESLINKLPGSSRYPLALQVYYPTQDGLLHLKGPSIRLEITSKKAIKRQLRFEYNPSFMSDVGETTLDTLFMDVGLTFYELLHYARYTRADFCMNIMLRRMQDYLFNATWTKTSQSFTENGMVETLNLGKSGGVQIRVYDKAKHLHGSTVEHGTIRVEARCEKFSLTLKQLANFKNPFDRVQIYSVSCKHPPYGVGHWRGFQDSCRLRGVNMAIKNLPVKERSAIKKAVSQHPVPWWKIAVDDGANWDMLLTAALEDAGLTNIPNAAPPLSLEYHAGKAA